MGRYWWIVIGVQIALSIGIGVVVTFALLFSKRYILLPPQYRSVTKKLNIEGSFYKALTLFSLGVFVVADATIVALPYVARGYVYVLGLMGVQVTQTLVAGVVVGIGYAAYCFKEAKQIAYGLVEVAFAAVSVIVAVKTTAANNRIGLATALIGAMYVASRGVSNFYEGKEEAAKKAPKATT